MELILAETSGAFSTALANVLSLETLLTILLCGLFGLFVGSIPGLTATMAVALIVPLTFFLSDVSAIAAIVTLTAVCIFAGDIPTTLVRIPGTPSSAAYTDDAYALCRQGRHADALGASLMFSVLGGLFGTALLCLFAPQLAAFAKTSFSTYENFWLYAIGLSCAAVVSSASRIRGAISLILGVLCSMVGLSEVHSQPRFTFGQDELLTGIHFIPAMIGLFGVSEVFRGMWKLNRSTQAGETSTKIPDTSPSLFEMVGHFFSRLLKRPVAALRSCSLGTLIGMVPGAGADIAAWISYSISKKMSPTPNEYGKGSIDSIADASSANNSSLAGAWIPALVLGIPGDSVTAILIGVLMMKNITPGPEIFLDTGQRTLVYGIYLTFIVANLLLIPLGYLGIRASRWILRVPREILLPVILLFCIVGAYSISGSQFDVLLMLGFGLLGFLLEHYRFPLGPVVLGILLGSELEKSFVQNLTKDPSLLAFFSRPVAGTLGIFCLLLWLYPLIRLIWISTRRTSGSANSGESGS